MTVRCFCVRGGELAALLGVLLLSAVADAAPCVVADAGGTAGLPPVGCEYESPDDVFQIIDGLPPATTIDMDGVLKDFFNVVQGPGGSLGGERHNYQAVLQSQLTGTGSLAGFNRLIAIPLNNPANNEMHSAPRTPGNPVQSFDTDMFMLHGQIVGDPDFDLLRITAGTNFGLPSPGHTTLTRLGPPGSDWNVDSFFDITYRIDFVGSPGSVLQGMSGSTTATIRMQAGMPVPEPDSLALMGMVGCGIGAVLLRRRLG